MKRPRMWPRVTLRMRKSREWRIVPVPGYPRAFLLHVPRKGRVTAAGRAALGAGT